MLLETAAAHRLNLTLARATNELRSGHVDAAARLLDFAREDAAALFADHAPTCAPAPTFTGRKPAGRAALRVIEGGRQ